MRGGTRRAPRGRRRPAPAQPMPSDEKALRAQSALIDARALDPVLLDMRPVTLITDYFLICHGTSNVHIRGLADAVLDALKGENISPYGVEGYDDARWILIDHGDLIVHIFAEEEREFYALERLWSDAARLPAPTEDERQNG
jgi:ribosome-associated protein